MMVDMITYILGEWDQDRMNGRGVYVSPDGA